jgi:hypothetical protein
MIATANGLFKANRLMPQVLKFQVCTRDRRRQRDQASGLPSVQAMELLMGSRCRNLPHSRVA